MAAYNWVDIATTIVDAAVGRADQDQRANAAVRYDRSRGGDPADLANGGWVDDVWVDRPGLGVIWLGEPGGLG